MSEWVLGVLLFSSLMAVYTLGWCKGFDYREWHELPSSSGDGLSENRVSGYVPSQKD